MANHDLRGSDYGAARADVVRRTHRIVREQAMQMRAERKRSRSLLAPLFICSSLLLVVCYAIWAVMAGYDPSQNGVPDASDQVLLFLLWSLPVTVLVLGLIWIRRQRAGERAL